MDLSDPELEDVLPVLYDIRSEVAEALKDFLKREDPASEYSLQKHRALVVQLDDAIKTAEEDLPRATVRELRGGAAKTGRISIEKLRRMVEEGERRFAGAASSLRIPVAKVLTNVDRTMMGRYAYRSQRYAGDVGRRIRNDLATGVIRGESIDQLAKRLLGGRYTATAKRGATAVADGMADSMFFRNKADAERLVRTEMVNAYTENQLESMKQLNEDDPGWKKMWDAANDMRVCPLCYDLDEQVVDYDKNFKGGIKGPPLHPNDRCSIVPWHERWSASGVAPSTAAG